MKSKLCFAWKDFPRQIQILLDELRVCLGWRRTVRFTDFLAEMVFWELPFFIRNDNKLAFLEKNPLKMLCLLCNTTQAADNNKVLSEDFFSKTANFLSFYERNQTTIVTSFYPKKSVKRTVRRQSRKTLIWGHTKIGC